jgi:hypothetical protein
VAEGAFNHSSWNGRVIPVNEHLNQALMHIFAKMAGGIQDEHLEQALTCLMMALSLKINPTRWA